MLPVVFSATSISVSTTTLKLVYGKLFSQYVRFLKGSILHHSNETEKKMTGDLHQLLIYGVECVGLSLYPHCSFQMRSNILCHSDFCSSSSCSNFIHICILIKKKTKYCSLHRNTLNFLFY